MHDLTVQMVGNLVADPQIRLVGSGAAVASFRVGVTPRHRNRDTGQWQDGASMFLSVSVWRGLAENVVATLHRGDRVFISGRLRQRAYTTQLGESRLVWEVDADLVAPDLSRHAGVLTKPDRRTSASAPAAERAAASATERDNRAA